MTYDWNKMVEITVPVGINGWVYAGSVTINGVTVDFPIGIPTSVPEPVAELLKKFIALEEDKNKVPAQDAGGGGGFVVTATVTLDEGTTASGTCTFDKTYEETLAAIKADRYVACYIELNGEIVILQACSANTADNTIGFAMSIMGLSVFVQMLADGTGVFMQTE